MKRTMLLLAVTSIIVVGIFATTAQAAKLHYTPHTKCTLWIAEEYELYVKWVGPWHAARLISFGWTCDPFPALPQGCGLTATGDEVVCEEEIPDVDSSFMCRAQGDTPVAIPVEEILSEDAGTRSLSSGWVPATAHNGTVEDGFNVTNVGTGNSFNFDCSGGNGKTWTDVSASVYASPNTPYANPIV